MDITTHSNAKNFYDRALQFLLQHEAENNLIIGISANLAENHQPEHDENHQPKFWTVEENGRLVAAAMMTPPHRLVMTKTSQKVIDALCNYINNLGINIPGVMGPNETVKAFASQWAKMKKLGFHLSHGIGVYKLEKVNSVTRMAGQLKNASLENLDMILKWRKAFAEDVNLQHISSDKAVRHGVENNNYFLWEHSLPVSMAVATGPTPNGIRIGCVYTPDEYRRNGYVTALVAELSQLLLNRGKKFCFLFTDINNPTSNSIYKRIGYKQVDTFAEYDFEPSI